ncbi:Twitchin [Chionoecetes opilio]|uniref:Twitchin n=1 Tax=Chionoecetes opilio TaxID=41210 RepID=A0A8J4Y4H0_CHIOP|nr:Twitchin [Chionoecetes opilio]
MKDGKKRQLVFKSIRMEDAGNYSCRTNADETACELIVDFENKFKKPLQDQTTFERQPATFEVELVDPEAPLTWFINGEEVKPGDNIEIVKQGAVHKLIIKEAAVAHEGEVKAVCGNLETSCQLSVGEGEKPPSIKPEEPIEGPVTKPLIFDVPYSVPGARISKVDAKLLKDGKPMSAKDVEVKILDKKVIYTIKKPSREQTGKYTIKMNNKAGVSTKEVKINMQDKPSPPTNFEVSEIFSTSCVLTFGPPKDDGGLPLTYYTIERQDFAVKGGWSQVAEIPADEPLRFKCEDLENKKQYKFKILISNKLGASDPNIHPKVILAKDPWDEPGKILHVEVMDWGPNHADLRWSRPESDGGSPITGYIIESRVRPPSSAFLCHPLSVPFSIPYSCPFFTLYLLFPSALPLCPFFTLLYGVFSFRTSSMSLNHFFCSLGHLLQHPFSTFSYVLSCSLQHFFVFVPFLVPSLCLYILCMLL